MTDRRMNKIRIPFIKIGSKRITSGVNRIFSMKQELYLASTSPRRIQILRSYIPQACILPPQSEERMPAGLSLDETVIYLAREKVESVRDQCGDGFIVGADTLVYNGRMIGKPKDRQDAVSILEELRCKEHCVATGVAVLNTKSGHMETFCEKTWILFGGYSRDEIEAYVDSGEPFDKAGAYALHLGWKCHALEVRGDFDNAIGFPWQRIRQLLLSMGYEF